MAGTEQFTKNMQISEIVKNLTLEKLVQVVKEANALYDNGQYEESIWWYNKAIISTLLMLEHCTTKQTFW